MMTACNSKQEVNLHVKSEYSLVVCVWLRHLIHHVFQGSLWDYCRVVSPCFSWSLWRWIRRRSVLLCLAVLRGEMTLVSVRGSVFKSLSGIQVKIQQIPRASLSIVTFTPLHPTLAKPWNCIWQLHSCIAFQWSWLACLSLSWCWSHLTKYSYINERLSHLKVTDIVQIGLCKSLSLYSGHYCSFSPIDSDWSMCSLHLLPNKF